MITVTLADGSQRKYNHALTVAAVAEDIGPGLANAALAARVNGEMVDLSHEITQDIELVIVTGNSEDGLEVIRHSCAHLMAQAVQRIFPDVEVTIGPVIDNGVYYDFATKEPFQEEDLEKITAEMKNIVKEKLPVKRFEMARDEAIAFFEKKGEKYKAEIIRDIPEDQVLSLYSQG